MEAAEKYLEESATMFDEFLKENDKNAVEAIKMYVCMDFVYIIYILDSNLNGCGSCVHVYTCRAEAATKAKLEKVTEIKRLNAHLILTKK